MQFGFNKTLLEKCKLLMGCLSGNVVSNFDKNKKDTCNKRTKLSLAGRQAIWLSEVLHKNMNSLYVANKKKCPKDKNKFSTRKAKWLQDPLNVDGSSNSVYQKNASTCKKVKSSVNLAKRRAIWLNNIKNLKTYLDSKAISYIKTSVSLSGRKVSFLRELKSCSSDIKVMKFSERNINLFERYRDIAKKAV